MDCFVSNETCDMRTIPTIALCLGLGFGLLQSATDAGAAGGRCADCGPTETTTRIVRTIHPLYNVTRYQDRLVTHHVTRLHYVVDVTRIQPIIHVDDVTRLHHVTVVRDVYAIQPRIVAPDTEIGPTPGYASGCGCMD